MIEQPECRWPGCEEDVAVSPDGGQTWWCWTHLTDDCLPELEAGVIGYCEHCHTAVVTWWVRWPAAPDLALHDHCRRPYLMGLADSALGREDAPERSNVTELRPRGTYGRRRAAGD